MRIYTVEQKQTQNITTLQANLRVVLSVLCDKTSHSYSSKNKVNIDESKVKSIKIGGNFIAYLTTDGQVFAVYYNVKENSTTTTAPTVTGEGTQETCDTKTPDTNSAPSSLYNYQPTSSANDHDSDKPEKKKRRRMNAYRVRDRVDTILSDLLKDYSSSSEDVFSTWSSPGSSPSKSENTRDRVLHPPPSTSTMPGDSAANILLNIWDNKSSEASDLDNSIESLLVTDMNLRNYYSPWHSRSRLTGSGEAQKQDSATKATQAGAETQTTSSTNTVTTLDEPEVSQPVQWLNSRNTSLFFTMIAATKCAVLLVCSDGQLWRWDMQDNSFDEHPLYKTYCGEKAVVKISSSNLRISVLLDSGEIAVFYDNFVSGGTPMIISELSSPACEMLPCLENETIIDVRSGDFVSVVLTKSGKILWWGMLQKNIQCTGAGGSTVSASSTAASTAASAGASTGASTGTGTSAGGSKTKTKTSRAKSIRSGSQVVLKNCMNDIPVGSLVYTPYPQSKLARVEGCGASNTIIVRLCDKSTSPKCGQQTKLETWSTSQTIVLETTLTPLGTVIGIHGTNAIIMTSRHTDPLLFKNEWKQYRRMFSEGQLDKLHDEDVEMEPKKSEDQVMDFDESSVASDTSHTNSAYPNLCVYPVSELEVYESGVHAHNQIQKTPVDLLASKHSNLQGFKVLVFNVDHVGNITALAKCTQSNRVYMLTKDGASDVCETIEQADAGFLSDMDKLDMITTPDITMAIDNNNTPFVPLIPTHLNARELNNYAPINAIAIKQEVSTVPGRSRLMVAIAKQPQITLPAILQGDLKYLLHLQNTTMLSSNKMKQKTEIYSGVTWDEVVKSIETERDACGRTALHICCIAKPCFKKTYHKPSSNKSGLPIRVDDSYFHSISMVKRNYSFEELRFRHYTLDRQKELKERDRWLNILTFICGLDKDKINLPHMLSLTDNAGYTPFLAAIASQNYNSAWYLLPIITELEKSHPGLMEKSIWKPLQHSTTAHHLLAQGPLSKILVVQHIPAWFTEQSLFNLFSQNYRSIYKVLIQQKPKNFVKSVGRQLFDPPKQLTVRDRILRSFMRGPSGGSSQSTSHHKYSQLQQGIVFFADPEEARKALVQMDGYIIPSRQFHQRVRNANIFSYNGPGGFFEISVRYAEKESRGYFLTAQKKKKSKVSQEFHEAQENFRRMLVEALIKEYKSEVNDVCESPLAALVNESCFKKLDDKRETSKISSISPEVHITPHRIERDLRHEFLFGRAACRTINMMTETSDNMIPPMGSEDFPSGSSSNPRILSRNYSLQHNLPLPHSYYFNERVHLDGLMVPRRSSSEIRDRANFSLSNSDIEEDTSGQGTQWGSTDQSSVNRGPDILPSYFGRLREDIRSAERDLEDVPPSSGYRPHSIYLPMHSIFAPDPSMTMMPGPNQEYPMTLPFNMSDGGSPVSADPSETAAAQTTSSSNDTPPAENTKLEAEKQSSVALQTVIKQLCLHEKVVIATIYCSYSNNTTLPPDIDFTDPKEEALEHPSKRRKVESEGDKHLFSLSDIERMMARVDQEVYSSKMTSFIHNLVANTTNGIDITNTLLGMLNRANEGALFISLLFVRSLTKYLALQLTNIGPRECLVELPEYKLISETKKLLHKFGWLGIIEIFSAAEALFLPLQYNVFKAQAHTSTTDHHIFPTPPGYMFSSSTSQAISLHPSTYLRQCPQLSDDTSTSTSRHKSRKLSLVADKSSHNDDDISGDEYTDEESSQDDGTHSLLSQINFFDYVENIFNPNPPQISTTDEDPYLMWSVDGRTSTFRPILRRQHSVEEMAMLKENCSERGKNILACVYSRLVKWAVDIACAPHDKVCGVLQSRCKELIQSWWRWLEPVVTSLEAQFVKASTFDLEKYSTMLKQGERKVKTMYNPGTLSKSSITGSFPQEYVMYLLDSHMSENNTSLPIIDIKSYKHIVYVFDAMFYVSSNWPRKPRQSGLGRAQATTKSKSESSRFLKRSPSLEFGVEDSMDNLTRDLERTVGVQLPLALQPHLLTPLINREALFSSSAIAKKKVPNWKGKESLKQSLRKTTTLLDQSATEFLAAFDTTTRVFSKYYLGEGPGIEKDSILNLRACYSGKIARFVRQIKEMKWLVQSQNRQDMRDLPPRIYNLHIYVNRKRLLADSFRCLMEMSQLHPVNYSVKFEGEEGGGPGVNRGWFSVMCSALKDNTKYPDKTLPLFHCPGRIPEQADILAPQPWNNESNRNLYKQRRDGYRACGRLIGLALWFKQTLPFKLCRHVWKYLLGRKLCWADLAFYNADMYEGLRAMLNDAKWMTEDEFVDVYPCSFEEKINGQMREFKEGGSEIHLTKQNVEDYIQCYSEMYMLGCIQDELHALKQGFTDIIPDHILAGLTAEDMALLLSGGSGDIPFDRLYNIITFANSIGCSQKRLEQFKRWFWKIVKDMSMVERQQLLYFATGSSTLPPLDHTTEHTRDRISITIDIQYDSRNALPMASTCGQRISIPLYRSYAMLKSKLSIALHCLSYGLG